MPTLIVFHTFPDPAATYQVFDALGSMAMSAMQPDISAGPMPRSFIFDNKPEEKRLSWSAP